MKYLILALIIFLPGCAWFSTQKSNASACWNDPICRYQAIEQAKKNGDAAGDVAAVSGVTVVERAAEVSVGYISLLILLCTLGAALPKHEKIPAP